ncbi:hypothetical protein Dimus_026236 [Dionaea muscipula]
MALSNSKNILIASLLLCFFLLAAISQVAGDQQIGGTGSSGSSTAKLPAAGPAVSPPTAGKLDCGAACLGRCSESKRPNLCRRACGTCCVRCNCVPPGTFGNYDACPCYATLTTRDNRRKCP